MSVSYCEMWLQLKLFIIKQIKFYEYAHPNSHEKLQAVQNYQELLNFMNGAEILINDNQIYWDKTNEKIKELNPFLQEVEE